MHILFIIDVSGSISGGMYVKSREGIIEAFNGTNNTLANQGIITLSVIFHNLGAFIMIDSQLVDTDSVDGDDVVWGTQRVEDEINLLSPQGGGTCIRMGFIKGQDLTDPNVDTIILSSDFFDGCWPSAIQYADEWRDTGTVVCSAMVYDYPGGYLVDYAKDIACTEDCPNCGGCSPLGQYKHIALALRDFPELCAECIGQISSLCCLDDGSCVHTSPDLCAAMGGVVASECWECSTETGSCCYYDDTPCEGPSGLGACCLDDGSICYDAWQMNLDAEVCNNLGGQWLPEPASCCCDGPSLGCDPMGIGCEYVCENGMHRYTCECMKHGVWHPGTDCNHECGGLSCSDGYCSAVVPADSQGIKCCGNPQDCADYGSDVCPSIDIVCCVNGVDQSQCEKLGCQWAGSSCCCFEPYCDCIKHGGQPGPGAVQGCLCSTCPCPSCCHSDLGACCFTDGDIIEGCVGPVDESTCTSNWPNGTFMGPGSVCEDCKTCNAPELSPCGTCCVSNGSMLECSEGVTEIQCKNISSYTGWSWHAPVSYTH